MIIKKHLWKQFFLSQKQCHFSWLSFKISTSRCDVLQVMPASGCGTINRASAGGGEGNGNRSRVIFKVRQAAFGGFAPYLCCPYVMSQIQVEHSRAIEYLKFTWSPSAIDLAGQGLLVKPGNIRQPRPFWCLSLKLAFRNHKLLNILCGSRQRSARLMENILIHMQKDSKADRTEAECGENPEEMCNAVWAKHCNFNYFYHSYSGAEVRYVICLRRQEKCQMKRKSNQDRSAQAALQLTAVYGG